MTRPEPDHSLIPQSSTAVGPISRLAERTLAERVAREQTAPATVARTLIVGPGGYDTIAGAVAEARDGDTVLVHPGTYQETVTVERSIALVGHGDRAGVIVEGVGVPCLRLLSTAARVANLSFRPALRTPETREARENHWPPGFGEIEIIGGAPTLVDLDIATDNAGILIWDRATPAIARCRINGGHGIWLANANGVIEGNEIFDTAHGAIVIRGEEANPVVRGNTIRDCDYLGIWIKGGAEGTIEANEVSRVAGAGIVIWRSTPAVRNNTIHDNQGGIFFDDGAGGTIEDNEIYDNAAVGVGISGEGTAPRVRNNTIRENQGGILIAEGAGGTIHGNEIYGNAVAEIGVVGEGSAPVVSGNAVSKGDDGIAVVDGASPTIVGNTTWNGGAGGNF